MIWVHTWQECRHSHTKWNENDDLTTYTSQGQTMVAFEKANTETRNYIWLYQVWVTSTQQSSEMERQVPYPNLTFFLLKFFLLRLQIAGWKVSPKNGPARARNAIKARWSICKIGGRGEQCSIYLTKTSIQKNIWLVIRSAFANCLPCRAPHRAYFSPCLLHI